MEKRTTWPFRLTFKSLFKKGDDYLRAEARHYYIGEDLERRLAEIEFKDRKELARHLAKIDLDYHKIDQYEYDKKLLRIDGKDNDDLAVLEVEVKHGKMEPYFLEKLRIEKNSRKGVLQEQAFIELDHAHGKITEYERDKKIAELNHKGVELEIVLLQNEFSHGNMDEAECAKRIATLRGEPWVNVTPEFDPEFGINGLTFYFDYNDLWIEELRKHGYTGHPDTMMQDWFAMVNSDYAEDGIQIVSGGPSPRVIMGEDIPPKE